MSSSDPHAKNFETPAAPALSSRNFLPILPLIFLFWLARYLYAKNFGFYADDYFFLGRALTFSKVELLQFVADPAALIRFESSGHPLHPIFITFGARLGWWLAEMHGIYVIAFLVGALNLVLFYWLITRIHSRKLAILASLFYILYPADTTQAYLTFALGIQPAILLILLAAHSYLSDRRWLSYLLSALALLTYETAFAIAFAFPLMSKRPWKSRRKEIRNHAAIIAGLLILAVGLRAVSGESRLQALSITDMLRIPLTHMIIGPAVSLGTTLYRPLQTIQSANTAVFSLALVMALISFCMMLWANSSLKEPQRLNSPTRRRSRGDLRIWGWWKRIDDEGTRVLFRYAATGLVMLILAYPFTFTVRAYAISGRDTRVHAAGVIGYALLGGAITLLILYALKSHTRRVFVIGLASLLFGLLGGFGLIVQQDYRLAWSYQQRFWSSLDQHAGGFEDGTILAVDPQGLIDTRYIDSNTWNLPYVLGNIYVFPSEWEQIPRAYRLLPEWRERALTNSAEIKVLDFKWQYQTIPWDRFRLVLTDNGEATAIAESLELDGKTYRLSTGGSSGPQPLDSNFLHDYLILK
ncbi:MAG: hypothetical protein PVF85_11260 [Anaerolineales bacterium]|jgi:hypothetical protein